jgi:hypothetical protein
MYFRSVIRKNPATQQYEGYYRLVESYRNEYGKVCHRTLHTIGFIDYDTSVLANVQRILNNRLDRKATLFEEMDAHTIAVADACWLALIQGKKIDVSDAAFEKSKRMIDADTIKHKEVREVGAEWMCYQTLEQLGLQGKLRDLGWKEEQIKLALTQIISRALYPHSECRTSRWIKENSAVCEVTGYPVEKITKDKLYKSALDLYEIKDQLEKHLSKKTNELFDLQDKIYIFDLSNTYFEGVKTKSKLAKYGRSKEKRSDCKVVVLAVVVNMEGFVKYSNVFEGNMADSQSLPKIIDNLRIQTSTEKRAVIVLDAGIATEENLKIIKEKGYDYVCVSRSKIKNYSIKEGQETVKVQTKSNQEITLQVVKSSKIEDYILRVKSPGKEAKEHSMKSKFDGHFTAELDKIKTSLGLKHGVKKLEKVNQRIGRAIEKYPSAAKFYNIEIKSKDDLATEILYTKKEASKLDDHELGAYFIRTSLDAKNELSIWTIYNAIREVESTFRCLKTDLDLRPIYHKNDDATVAHLHLGILGYWLVNTIRYQLKQKQINCDWQEIVRITNTQKIITTTGHNKDNELIYIRRCSEPNEKVKQIYTALNYKNYPFVKRKFVVPKPEIKKFEKHYLSQFDDG